MIKTIQDVLHYADDYVHGLLSEVDAESLERLCERNAVCRAALEEAQRRHDALGSLPPTEAGEKLVGRTMEHIVTTTDTRQIRQRTYRRVVLAATAASLLIIGATNVYYYKMQPSPYDLRILGQEHLLADSPASLRVAVFNTRTGESMSGVPITMALLDPRSNKQIELAQFTTGESGEVSPQFTLPNWDNGNYTLRVTASPNGTTEEVDRTIELTRSWRVMISSDKPVYQPGQTIHLRSLALARPNLRPVAGESVQFSITDPRGNVIFRQHDVTGQYGLASADCALATEITEGDYRVECQVGDTVSETTVTVKKYVLPKFRVVVSLDEPFYAPGERVTGSLQSDYFFGQPVVDADVLLEIRGADFTQNEIATQELVTDDTGRSTFEFTLPRSLVGREQDGGAARFHVAATVVDTAGQTCAAGASRIVTTQPIKLEVIPESGTLVSGEANRIYVYASYADGRPAQARLNVGGFTETIETSELGVAMFEVTPREDRLSLTMRATDEEGRIGRAHVELAVGQIGSDFVLRADKAVYDGGETMTLTALGGGVEPVFVDLLKDGQTMLTTSLDMQSGRGSYQFDIPPDLFGTIEVVAYRYEIRSGLPVRKSRVVFIRQPRQLNITATWEEEYRPGVPATLRFEVTDGDGDPVPAALSLSGVDEAVFAVLEQRAGMEEIFFLLEQEMLEPVYAIYPWSPFGVGGITSAARTEFEQALFSRTSEAAIGVGAIPEVFFADPGSEPTTIEPWDEVVVESGETPFTLAAASFVEKVRSISEQRRMGLFGVGVAWFSMVGVVMLAGTGYFAVFYPRQFTKVAAMVGCFVLIGSMLLAVLLPSVKSARFAAMTGEADTAMAPEAMDDFAWAEGADLEHGAEATGQVSPPIAGLVDPSEDSAGDTPSTESSSRPRVRQWFPETLLWRPELITDENGVATLELDMADSITTWRISASAVSGQGQLGGNTFPLRVFQPFFVELDLPVALTRNDTVGVPLVVYNYLDQPQTVELTVVAADWYEKLGTDGPETLTLELAPGEVRSLTYSIRVLHVGYQELEVTARAGDVADAIRRQIEVVPDGRRVEEVASGTLGEPFQTTLNVPEDHIEGSVRAIVKLYPSTFSQVVEGLENIFRMPGGCFEQTSSTTYPNVLALQYLRETGQNVPEVEAKARQYIHVGYQRLISFEVTGGGFDWFGNPPANQTLTAYGLMEFDDMAEVYDVDPQLIARTRNWLLSKRRSDGRWAAEIGMLNDGLAGSVQRGGDLDLATTAYIAWAVFGTGEAKGQSQITLNYLLAREPGTINDPYMLAILTNAIAAIDPNCPALSEYVARLDSMKQTDRGGKIVWWEQGGGEQTMFYGSGVAGQVETTAMATLAMLHAGGNRASSTAALTWLIENKDANGTWYSTQATVLAFRALLAGADAPLGGDVSRQIEIMLGDEVIRTVNIAPDQSDVMQLIDLSDRITGGVYDLLLRDISDSGTGYQVTLRYHVDQPVLETEEPDPLSIDIVYDRNRLEVDETVSAVATVTNNMNSVAPMVILDLPIPGGFTIEAGELEELAGSGKIAKYQITARKVIVYLRGLAPGESLELNYRLRATMPVEVTVPDAEAYEYYDPATRGSGGGTRLEAIGT